MCVVKELSFHLQGQTNEVHAKLDLAAHVESTLWIETNFQTNQLQLCPSFNLEDPKMILVFSRTSQ